MATDNSTVEAAIYKGNSASEKLYDLVLQLKAVEMQTGARIFVTHVSGKRMVAQGTDAVSRGSLQQGVALGEVMTNFCPWAKNACEVSPTLLNWLKSWSGDDLETLQPAAWFGRGQDHNGGYVDEAGYWRPIIKKGTFLWAPPSAAAEAALEELRKAQIKRQNSTHLFVVPRLFTPCWLKQVYKCANLVVFIAPQHSFWGPECFKPLCVAVCFPFSQHRPWQLRGTPGISYVERKVRKTQKTSHLDPGIVLRKLVLESRRLCTMLARSLWRLLYFGSKRELPRSDSQARGRKRKGTG